MTKTDQRRAKRRLRKVITANIENRHQRVGALYCEGKTQSEIAAIITEEGFAKATQSTVSLDLAAVREKWRQNAVMKFDERLSQELAKLDNLERIAMAAWERSCEDAEEVTTMKSPPRLNIKLKNGDELKKKTGAKVTQTITKVKGQCGNPAFLAEARACVEKRCKLLGLLDERAVNINQNTTVADFTTLLGRKSDPNIADKRTPVIPIISDPVEDQIKALEDQAANAANAAKQKPSSNGKHGDHHEH